MIWISYKFLFAIDPEICFGKPRIKGTRIAVSFILELLEVGQMFEYILEEYPHLVKEDISVAVRYARKLVEKEQILKFDNNEEKSN